MAQDTHSNDEAFDTLEWVFGYGSLMWNPGFSPSQTEKARLDGFHRSFCIYSHHYRGTPQRPGLVLGLDAGGLCDGFAFRVGRRDWSRVVEYLNERELIGYAYRPAALDVALLGTDQRVTAYTFVADPDHPTYAGDLGPERSAEVIMNATGIGGLNRDYLINTVGQLEAHGFEDPTLHALLERVSLLTGLIDQGGGI